MIKKIHLFFVINWIRYRDRKKGGGWYCCYYNIAFGLATESKV